MPKRGELYTYRVAEPDGSQEAELGLDLGFGIEHDPEEMTRAAATPGEVVTVSRGEKRPDRFRLSKATTRRAKLYTYRAKVLRVIDGDTILVKVDLGFRIRIKQRLRLRGIDAPEMGTVEGGRTRDYVKAVLAGTPWIVVTTTRPDKYGRYLADVYYPKNGRSPRAKDAKGAKRTRTGGHPTPPNSDLPQRRRGAEDFSEQQSRRANE